MLLLSLSAYIDTQDLIGFVGIIFRNNLPYNAV